MFIEDDSPLGVGHRLKSLSAEWAFTGSRIRLPYDDRRVVYGEFEVASFYDAEVLGYELRNGDSETVPNL